MEKFMLFFYQALSLLMGTTFKSLLWRCR